MKNYVKLSDIKAKPIPRNKTGFSDLDELYGRSDIPVNDEFVSNNIGMPKGKISLWAGESGVGKSRLCIEVAKRFSTFYKNGTVLYIQTESSLEDFAGWSKDTTQYDRIYCSNVETMDDIINIIYQVKPKLIFIDSVNEIVDFIGNAKSSTRLIKGEGDKSGLKQATHDVGAHLILLGQLNGDKTIKGGTSLPHLVDIALNVVWEDKVKGIFRVEVGAKHRYGSRDKIARFLHSKEGVSESSTFKSTPTLVPNNVDPKSLPSKYVGETIVDKPFYAGGILWDVEQQEVYLKLRAEKVASGKIKLDNNGKIIPDSPPFKGKKRAESEELEDGIENSIIRGNLSVSVWKSIFPSWFK